MKIKRIILSDIITTTLSSALHIYLYWFTYHSFSNQRMIGLIGFGQLSAIFLSTLGGGMADRMNKLYFIKIVKGLKVLLLFLAWFFHDSIPLVFFLPILMFLSTVIGSFLSPTLEALIPFLAEKEEELFRLNSMIASLTQTATIVAIVLSAVYISFFSFSAILFFSMCLSFFSLLILLGLKVDTSVQSISIVKTIQEGITYLLKTPYIRDIIPIAFIINFCFWSIFLLLPKIANDHFSFLNLSYSVLEFCFACGGIAGGVIFNRYLSHYPNRGTLFYRTLCFQSLTLFLLGLDLFLPNQFVSYAIMLFLWFLYALFNTIFSILYFGNLQLHIPRAIIGSVFGALLTIFSLINPLAAIVSGFLVSVVSTPILVTLLSFIMLLTSVSVRWIPSLLTVFDERR